uniref:DUF1230-domain-containing protein n=1 Tax=Pseudo-nitzschia australis TaxID=44445 RepID=A0A7S4AUG2_9STRA|mmetsp:Transcript_9263/g.20100  ORF Transcript_9263/g.20100 Transcript_9263/m.20100 type:complete len:300 (-) Transcript_9263:274-1173(-)
MQSGCSITKRTARITLIVLAISRVCNGFVVNDPNTNMRSLSHHKISTTRTSTPFTIDSANANANANTALAASSESDDALYSFGAEVVPEGQRPVNEYLDMKRAPLFGWGTNEVGLQGLLIRLGIVYVAVFALVGYPIAGATFTQDGYLLQKIAAANVGTLGFEIALLVRIYSGWGYVGSRLQSKVIEYEETGWYDGNFEPKTEAELKRDKFLYLSDVQPAVDRLKLLTLGAAALWVASCVGLNAANQLKPTFNEYDPRVLKMVIQDEDFANAAAKAAGSRPTYCDNRYYRAVANGGQGC